MSGVARRRLADDLEHREEVLKTGSKEEIDKKLLAFDAQTATRDKSLEKLRGELKEVVAEEKKLHELRGDLAGRIELASRDCPRRKGAEVRSPAARPSSAAQTKEGTSPSGPARSRNSDTQAAELQEKHKKLQETLDKEVAAERSQFSQVAKFKEQRDALAALDGEDRQNDRPKAEASEASILKEALTAVQSSLAGLAKLFTDTLAWKPNWDFAADPAAAIAALRETVQVLKQKMAEEVGRKLAERKALADLLQRIEAQIQALARRQSDLEREEASAKAEAGAQQMKDGHRKRTFAANVGRLQGVRGGPGPATMPRPNWRRKRARGSIANCRTATNSSRSPSTPRTTRCR